jgi:hypothetical protein
MTSYIISYELRHLVEHQEADLLAALEVFEDRCKALATVWFVCSPWSAVQIRSHLVVHLGQDDSLIVEPLPLNEGWSAWVGQDVRDWLAKHLGPSN